MSDGEFDGTTEGPIANQPFDEAVQISDTESVDDPSHGSPGMDSESVSPKRQTGGEEVVQNQPYDEAVSLSDDGDSVSPDDMMASKGDDTSLAHSKPGQANSDLGADSPPQGPDDTDSSSSSDSDDDAGAGLGQTDDSGGAVFEGVEGGYDPKEFENLDVTSDIKDLFQYITRYRPHTIELEERLKPFIPDYIPSVGDIDAFIKVPRPDGKQENLGLTVLDEPIYQQSDATVIEMQLRHQSKQAGIGAATVSSIENASKNPKRITSWVDSVSELHSSKPPTEVLHSKPMPDIESLMQVWDPQFEEILGNTPLPNPGLDLPLEEYARIVCAIFDIPVHQNCVESLHVLFTLFSEFKNNVHFQQEMLRGNDANNAGPQASGADTMLMN